MVPLAAVHVALVRGAEALAVAVVVVVAVLGQAAAAAGCTEQYGSPRPGSAERRTARADRDAIGLPGLD